MSGYRIGDNQGWAYAESLASNDGPFPTYRAAMAECARLNLAKAEREGIADARMTNSRGEPIGPTYREYYTAEGQE